MPKLTTDALIILSPEVTSRQMTTAGPLKTSSFGQFVLKSALMAATQSHHPEARRTAACALEATPTQRRRFGTSPLETRPERRPERKQLAGAPEAVAITSGRGLCAWCVCYGVQTVFKIAGTPCPVVPAPVLTVTLLFSLPRADSTK